MTKKKQHIICAMSGGVDSSVAAALLKKQGFKVTGIFLRFWQEIRHGEHRGGEQQRGSTSSLEVEPPSSEPPSSNNHCCSQNSYDSARQVCQKLDIKLYTLNCAKEFKKYVVDYFIDSFKKGLTPNPCIACNKYIKFGFLFKKLDELNANYLATGHYAKVRKQKTGNRKPFQLLRAKDNNKDQSYFLYNLNQQKLAKILFPLGDLTKPEVRKLAKKFNLPTAEKAESQEICFIQEKKYHDFLKRNLKNIKPGKIKTVSGEIIGEHQGLCFYTLGQRKGIGLGLEKSFYIVKLDFKNNILVVSDNPKDKLLYNKNIKLKNFNLIGERPALPYPCKIKIRSTASPAPGKIISLNKTNTVIKLNSPQRAVMPGQSAVIYKKDALIGGGVIAKTE